MQIKLNNLLRNFLDKKQIGSFSFRFKIGAFERIWYAYILYNSAALAKKLGYTHISAIEYGVANGNGLLILERYAEEIKKLLGVQIDIYGFDTGKGLPEPTDYKDLPYHWRRGIFTMDEKKLSSKLKNAKLVIGNIKETSLNFFSKYNPAPVGALIHDFDFYSSTKIALSMLNVENKHFLPRVYCFFDDIIGSERELYNDFTGERLAIEEFNSENKDIKISKTYHFLKRKNKAWHHQIRITHFFKHEKYNTYCGDLPNW